VCVCVCVRVRVCLCVCVHVLSMDHHLVVMKRLVCFSDPWSYVLVGSPLVNRSGGRFQTKCGPSD